MFNLRNQKGWICKKVELTFIVIGIIAACFLYIHIERKAPVCEKHFHNVPEKVMEAVRNYQEGR